MSAKHPCLSVFRPNRWWVWLLISVLAGCTLSTRPMEPPVVRIASLELIGNDQVHLDLMLTNLNPEPLDPARVLLKLAIDEQDWVVAEQTINWQVSANARETVSLVLPHQNGRVLAWLQEVSQNQRPSVRWSLALSLNFGENIVIETDDTGFLYRVPGQPNRFR